MFGSFFPEFNTQPKVHKDQLLEKFKRSSNVLIKSIVNQHSCAQLSILIDKNKELLKTRDEEGNTLIHIACYASRFDVVQLLTRKYNVDATQANKAQVTPLQLSMTLGVNAQFLLAISGLSQLESDIASFRR